MISAACTAEGAVWSCASEPDAFVGAVELHESVVARGGLRLS